MAGQKPPMTQQRNRRISRSRFSCLTVSAWIVAVCAGCDIKITAPPETGFLAIVLSATGPATTTPGQKYTMRIRELSGFYPINQTFRVEPNDTITGTYPLATYVISIDSVPAACTSRAGFTQQALISTAGNTAITRFNFECNALLGITVFADGHQVDSSFVWTVTEPGGAQRVGTASATDTIYLNDLKPGVHTVELAHIADHCAIISDGWRKQRVEVKPPASASVYFRIKCTDLTRAPRIIHFASSFANGVAGFYAEVVEPNRNIEDAIGAMAWALSDCFGNAVLPGTRMLQEGIRFDRIRNDDTARIAVTVPMPDHTLDLDQVCNAVRFEDLEGNTTLWTEERNRNETGRRPMIIHFNAIYTNGTIRVALSADDFDGDLAGAFLSISFRDGSQNGVLDGKPDVRTYNTVGYLPPFDVIPTITPQGKFMLSDVISINVDLIDRAGNMTRATDGRLDQ